MIGVRYTDVEEFTTELVDRADEIEDRVVRITKIGTPKSFGFTSVHVVAGAIISGRLVQLRRHAGDLWGTKEDEEVQVEANKLVEDIERALEPRDLRILAGIFEEG